MLNRWRSVATITKAHGNKGKVVAIPAPGLPMLLEAGLRVAVVPPPLRGTRYHEIVSVENSSTAQCVELSDIHSREAAEQLKDKSILVAEEDLPENFELLDQQSLIGRKVVDDNLGITGHIHEIMSGVANDVWVLFIEPDNRELLIPVIDEVVLQVPDEGPISICIPQGLM